MKHAAKPFLETTAATEAAAHMLGAVRSNLANHHDQMAGLSDTDIQTLKDRYSHFADSYSGDYLDNSTFVIDKLHPPKGWFHYMINLKQTIRDVGVSIVAQDGAGVLSLDSVLFGPITKLGANENYMHVSQVYRNTRNIWVKTETCEVFSLIPQPHVHDHTGALDAAKYDAYSCEQGTGYTVITSERDGLRMQARIFMPFDTPCEVWTISITNLGKKKRSVALYPEINFGLDSHPSHYFVGMAVSEAEYDAKRHAIIAKNLDIKNSFPRWGAFLADRAPDSFDSNADTYYKFGASIMYPPSVFDESLSDTEARQPLKGMVGAFQYKFDIEPHDFAGLHCAVTALDPGNDIDSQVDAVFNMLHTESVTHELTKVRAHWKHITDSYLINTPSIELDRTFNIWGKYQSILCSRFNSPYDLGTRDMFQYLLANCVFEPEYVKLFVPYMLGYQYRDGRIPRQICKFSSMHDLRNFMDCQLWAPDLVELYVRETGDYALLDEQVEFLNDDNTTHTTGEAASVYTHLLLAVKSVYEDNLGPHGLCRLGYGGWNDALDGLRGDNSESVWLSQLLVYAARKMRALAEWKNDEETIAYLTDLIKKVSAAINKAGWDDTGYYIFGYDNEGAPVGSSHNDEGRKHLNENSWALLSDVIPHDRIDAVIRAMAELKTPFGHRLLTPYTKKSSTHVGRIADQAQGHFENGSVYQHGVLFWATALLTIGHVDEAFNAFVKLTNENRLPDISTNPPTYHSNYTAVPDNSDYGKEPYYPFSGSHAWRMKFLVDMIGLVPLFDRFRIDPQVPSVWRESVDDGALIFKARKRSNRIEHKNVYLNLHVYRDDSLEGERKVVVNNEELPSIDGETVIGYDDPLFKNKGKADKEVIIAVYV